MLETTGNIIGLVFAIGCLLVVLHIARRSRSRAIYFIVAAMVWLSASRSANVFDLGWYTKHNRSLAAVSIVLLFFGLLGIDWAMGHFPKRVKRNERQEDAGDEPDAPEE